MSGKVKIVSLAALSVLILTILLIELRSKTPEAFFAPRNIIRLHVVANSDSGADQDLKRKVRDEILRTVAPDLSGAANVDSARETVRSNLSNIREIASREVLIEGKDYPVRVELDTFAFPTKHYGPFVLPTGDYEAVRVVIGDGGGANWWCVLFPPLCFVDMSKDTTTTWPENTSLSPGLPVQESNYTQEQFPVAAVSLAADAGNEEYAAPTGNTINNIEYRFKILDLLCRKQPPSI